MIISHRLKFAFFRVPKTGSTTMETMLRMTGLFDDNDIASPLFRFKIPGLGLGNEMVYYAERDQDVYKAKPHSTPQECIDNGYITIEQLREYDCYAALRDPYDRAVSVFAQTHARVPETSPEMFAKKIRAGKDYRLLEKPQADYFFVSGEEVLTPVDFRSFVSSLNTLLASVPGNTMSFPYIPNFNPTTKQPNTDRARYVDADSEIKGILATKFADDISLYESHYGTL